MNMFQPPGDKNEASLAKHCVMLVKLCEGVFMCVVRSKMPPTDSTRAERECLYVAFKKLTEALNSATARLIQLQGKPVTDLEALYDKLVEAIEQAIAADTDPE